MPSERKTKSPQRHQVQNHAMKDGCRHINIDKEMNPAELRIYPHTQENQMTGSYINTRPIQGKRESLKKTEHLKETLKTTYGQF